MLFDITTRSMAEEVLDSFRIKELAEWRLQKACEEEERLLEQLEGVRHLKEAAKYSLAMANQAIEEIAY